MAPGVLAQVLGDLPNVHNDNLLVGFDTSDDASVFRVGENLGLVQSIDFFPPMVDDPFLFGQIAAANSLSDIYAMGGRPSHAMNLLCIPSCLGVEVAGQILAGGADKCVEAGCSIAGGHTINDDELGHKLMKAFIFAVTQQEELPATMLFYNGGAKLTVEGSPVLDDLKGLAEQGVEILTCGTCLDHYGIKDQLAVGEVTNMYVIVEKMEQAVRVVRP